MNICYGDPSISISLKDDDNLWSSFNIHTTEMIVTKPGRKIFPKLTVIFSGLNPNVYYGVRITLNRTDKYKYRYAGGKWTRGNEEEEQEGKSPPLLIHRDGMNQMGSEWMRRPVKFHDFKLTNNPDEDEKHMVFVQSLHKYTPLVEIFEYPPHLPQSNRLIRSQSLDIASFIVVTAYQNDAIKKLKVDNNPFAAGLRQKSDSPNSSSSSESDYSSRKRPSNSPISSSLHPPPSFPLQMDPMIPYPIMSPFLPPDSLIQYNHIFPPFSMPNWNPYFPTGTDDFHFNPPIIPQ